MANRECPVLVSIQLLLLFYIIKHDKHVVSNGFNTTFVTVLLESSMKILICTVQFQYNFCYCSMVNDSIRGHYNVSFQYNFCYCSMLMDMFEKEDGMEFQYNFCYCSICDAAVGQRKIIQFQYNFCYCSI